MTKVAYYTATDVFEEGFTYFSGWSPTISPATSDAGALPLLNAGKSVAVGALTTSSSVTPSATAAWTVDWWWQWSVTKAWTDPTITATFSSDPIVFQDQGSYTTSSYPTAVAMSAYGGDVLGQLRTYNVVYTGSSVSDYIFLNQLSPTGNDGTASASDTPDQAKADVLAGKAGLYVDGGAGADTILAGAGRNFVFAGSGDDDVTGYQGNVLHGGDGTDVLRIFAHSDLTFRVADALQGQATLAGATFDGFEVFRIQNTNADTVLDLRDATLATSKILGFSSIAFMGGHNIVYANGNTLGTIRFSLLGAEDQLVADLSQLTTSITLTPNHWSYAGFAGWTSDLSTFERMTVTAGSAADSLTGTSGSDYLAGGGGNDTITGGAGDDTLLGGPGDDTLTGGSGADVFVMQDGGGTDTVTDFNSADGDKIDLTDVSSLRSFADFQAHLSQSGGDAVLDLGNGSSLIVKSVVASTLTSSQVVLKAAKAEVHDVSCFYAGTLIRTARGQVPVEHLTVGDFIPCHDGELRALRWLGRQTVSTCCAHPERIWPVRITAGALGAGLPCRDLLVSPDHGLFLEGCLVAAGALVNGTTIRRETDVPDTFTYFHVEVSTHALLWAEESLAETFMDNVGRLSFDNWAAHQALGGLPGLRELPYARAKSARQLPRAVRQLLAQADRPPLDAAA